MCQQGLSFTKVAQDVAVAPPARKGDKQRTSEICGTFPAHRGERGGRTAFVGFVHVDYLRPNRRRESAPQGICEEAAHWGEKKDHGGTERGVGALEPSAAPTGCTNCMLAADLVDTDRLQSSQNGQPKVFCACGVRA